MGGGASALPGGEHTPGCSEHCERHGICAALRLEISAAGMLHSEPGCLQGYHPIQAAPTAAASLCQRGPARMYRKYPGSVATMPTPSAASSSGDCGASTRSRGATRPVTSANRRAKNRTCDGRAVHFSMAVINEFSESNPNSLELATCAVRVPA